MGKKRIIKKHGGQADSELRARSLSRLPKRRITSGVLHIQATYNNTKLLLTDNDGNAVMWSSSGALGFRGAKRGTPYAASKVAELVAEKAAAIGLREVSITIKGVGAGRESATRTFASKGIDVRSIKDSTPIPYNGPRPRKPRRV